MEQQNQTVSVSGFVFVCELKSLNPSDADCYNILMWCLDLIPEDRPTFDELQNHAWLKEEPLDVVQVSYSRIESVPREFSHRDGSTCGMILRNMNCFTVCYPVLQNPLGNTFTPLQLN